MRKNTQEVMKAWRNGDAKRSCEAIWTDGEDVFSYWTCLLTTAENGRLVFNATSYSPTTSRQQSGMLLFLRDNGSEVFSTYNHDRGASPYSLVKAYEAVTKKGDE
jgi:hypothetical protein